MRRSTWTDAGKLLMGDFTSLLPWLEDEQLVRNVSGVLAGQGITHRGLVWKLLLGVLPFDVAATPALRLMAWNALLTAKREEYAALKAASVVVPAGEDASDDPLQFSEDSAWGTW